MDRLVLRTRSRTARQVALNLEMAVSSMGCDSGLCLNSLSSLTTVNDDGRTGVGREMTWSVHRFLGP
jgi:hypothetical protein